QYINENDYDEIIISVSGGKDSTVTADMCLEIAKRSNKTRVLFGNTSNETHFTYKYVKDTYGEDLEIASPSEGFFPWVKRNGFVPTRFTRACCSIFKEGNITPYLDNTKKLLQVCGIRRDESAARSKYEQVRKGKWENKLAQQNWNMYLPIIDFDDLDVWCYMLSNNTQFNELYEFGMGRVGCTCCPYRSDYELKLTEYFLPTYDRNWKKLIGDIFVEQGFAINMNCTKQEFIDGAWKAGIVRTQPTDEVVQDFADNKGIDFEQAKKYFKSNRCSCGKRLSKDMIGLNMKILGRNTGARMCLKCLAEFQETDVKSLKKQIAEFKADGCGLF
ncbi:MAG: phosphoadenosine phosphosulfate reductase family protein, partial [Fusobacteriaceae bacterium]